MYLARPHPRTDVPTRVTHTYAVAVTDDQGQLGALGRLWVLATVAYGGLRVFLVGTFIADYGLNIIAYACIEIISSATLGVSTAKLTRNYRNRNETDRPRKNKLLMLLAIGAYFAPDSYILAFAHRMPARVLFPVLVIVSSGTVAAIVKFRRVRSGATPGS